MLDATCPNCGGENIRKFFDPDTTFYGEDQYECLDCDSEVAPKASANTALTGQTIVFWTNGDASANIASQQIEVNFKFTDDLAKEEKIRLFDELASVFAEQFDSKFHYAYSDELADKD